MNPSLDKAPAKDFLKLTIVVKVLSGYLRFMEVFVNMVSNIIVFGTARSAFKINTTFI
jgi:hypothetical protein